MKKRPHMDDYQYFITLCTCECPTKVNPASRFPIDECGGGLGTAERTEAMSFIDLKAIWTWRGEEGVWLPFAMNEAMGWPLCDVIRG